VKPIKKFIMTVCSYINFFIASPKISSFVLFLCVLSCYIMFVKSYAVFVCSDKTTLLNMRFLKLLFM